MSARLLRPATVVAAALVVLLVVCVVVSAVYGSRVRDARAAADRRADALADAQQIAVNFTTLDHETFDEDVDLVLDGATGAFRDEFAAGVEQTRELVTENRSTSTGTVASAAVVSSDADSARVIVVVDAEVTNVASPTPVPRHYRVQLDLALTGDRWLASDLTFVG